MAYNPLQSLQVSPFHSIVPVQTANLVKLVPLPTAPEMFAGQQLAHHFRNEVEHRQAFEDYCHRYHVLALQNQQEMASMVNDIDIRSWFSRKRRN